MKNMKNIVAAACLVIEVKRQEVNIWGQREPQSEEDMAINNLAHALGQSLVYKT